MEGFSRRAFLKVAAAGAAWGLNALPAYAQSAGEYAPLKKAVILGMLPRALSESDRYKLAKDLGFDGVESPPFASLDEAKRVADRIHEAGLTVHSIIYGGWEAPLSDPDPAVVEKGLNAVRNALRCAHVMGADTVLLVPAVVTDKVRYADAYERSQRAIRELIPAAAENGVVLAVENVWNKFLLSPLEFRDYIDSFESEWVRAYFDCGNVVIFGYPEDWIRTLGPRIRKVHVKDFQREKYAWKPLYEGDINWAEVRKALREVGYNGWITAELPDGDENYLREVSRRMSLIGEGAAHA